MKPRNRGRIARRVAGALGLLVLVAAGPRVAAEMSVPGPSTAEPRGALLAAAGMTATPLPAARVAPGGLASMQAGSGAGPASEPHALTSRQALVPALMSAVLPGSGQIRNGSLLRGLLFASLEVTGWVAWSSFDHQADEKYADLQDHGGRYWDYDRYRRVASNPDSCQAHGCPCGLYSTDADSLIRIAGEQGGSRFFDYLTRDTYACGWDTQLSRGLYLGLFDDREDLLDTKRTTGRLIFLNHVVAAVDAFLQARRLRVAGVAEVGLRMAGSPGGPHPQVVFTAHWD